MYMSIYACESEILKFIQLHFRTTSPQKEVLGFVLANEAKPKPEGYTDLGPIWFSVFFLAKMTITRS